MLESISNLPNLFEIIFKNMLLTRVIFGLVLIIKINNNTITVLFSLLENFKKINNLNYFKIISPDGHKHLKKTQNSVYLESKFHFID